MDTQSLTTRAGHHPTVAPAEVPAPYARIAGVALIAAPVTLAASTVAFVTRGTEINDGVLGGTLSAVSCFLFVIGFVGLLRLMEVAAPRAAAVATAIAAIGFSCGGVAFSTQAILTAEYGHTFVDDAFEGEATANDAWTGIFAFLPWGWFAPLTFLLVGVLVWRTGILTRWSGALLALGGLLFISSRPERIDWLAMVADGVLIAALVPLGLTLFRGGAQRHR